MRSFVVGCAQRYRDARRERPPSAVTHELPAQLSPVESTFGRALSGARFPSARYLGGVLALAAAYFGAAKLGQTLRYTASVSAIWPPAGLGMAVLYVFGLRWWPGVFLGEAIVNIQLLAEHGDLPVGSVLGQWAGNMAEVLVGAWLLLRLIGPKAALDRASQVGLMIIAASAATAISATVGTASMLAGGVIGHSEVPTFWRTWFLGDTAGAMIVLPLALTWAGRPARRLATPVYRRGCGGDRARGRAREPGREGERAPHLSRLPGADLGGVSPRPARE